MVSNLEPLSILLLPKNVRHRIYFFALAGKVELEVNSQCVLLTRICRLLRVSTIVRNDLLEACRLDKLQLEHTFK